MKKLNKILAAISTAALTFCVLGTQTQAKVITNKQGVPTHIEADTNNEFFGDLQQVLNHIESRLVVEEKEVDQIDKLFLDKAGLTKNNKDSIPHSEYAQKEYNYALTPKKIHIRIAEGYLYSLLLNSKINNSQPAVYILRVKVGGYTGISSDIVFQLPSNPENYCICNLRWWNCPNDLFKSKRPPVPMSVEDAFREGPEFQEHGLTATLWIPNPKLSVHQLAKSITATKLKLTERGSEIIHNLIRRRTDTPR